VDAPVARGLLGRDGLESAGIRAVLGKPIDPAALVDVLGSIPGARIGGLSISSRGRGDDLL
jgi:hypothetical protein